MRRMTVGGLVGMLVTMFFGAQILIRCNEQPGSAELQRGQRIMYQVMGEDTLRKAGFYEAYPEGRPSDFVEFADSEAGRVLWPITIAQYKGSSLETAGRGPGRVLRPEALSFSAHRPDPDAGKQIVYVPLDEEGQIQLRGLEAPDAEPAFVYTWDFPSDAGEVDLRR